MIKVKNLGKNFDKTAALKSISLSVQKGDIFGIVGPDGAGKTTLIRTILGLYLPSEGELTVLGEKELENAKNRVGYVPQQFSLNTDMTVWENIALFANLQGMKSGDFEQRAASLLEMVWLAKFTDRLAGDLSGGMKQKLALVCGIIHSPELLMLDEPTTGVDPVSRREFWQMLYKLNKEGLTIVVSTPYMDEVELCMNIAFLHLGQIRAIGSPQKLLQLYPHKMHRINGLTIQKMLECIKQFPQGLSYIKGDSLMVSGQTVESIQSTLAAADSSSAEIKEAQPSLEDLFGYLSGEEAL